MPRVWISIGSNIDRTSNIHKALTLLQQHLGKPHLSSLYESAPVGFCGPPFYNLVAGYTTKKSAQTIMDLCQKIEQQLGRRRSENRFSSRTIDLDLLTYGDQSLKINGKSIPRKDILDYSFVLYPLVEIAPNERHPLSGRTYTEHWHEARVKAHHLRKVKWPWKHNEY